MSCCCDPTTTSGTVDDVTGSNDIVVTPTTGSVVVSGENLLPLDGSRSMAGNLQLNNYSIYDVSQIYTSTIDSTGSSIDVNTNLNLNSNNISDVGELTTDYLGGVSAGSVTLTSSIFAASNSITGAGTINGSTLSGTNISGTTINGTTINGVALTTSGSGANFLADDGSYKAISGGSSVGVESLPYASATGVETIWNGPSGDVGDMHGVRVKCLADLESTMNMVCYCVSNPDVTGEVKLGVYDAAFQRIGQTSGVIVSAASEVGAGFTFSSTPSAGDIIYLVLWSGGQNNTFLRGPNGYNVSPNVLGFQVSNVDVSTGDLPADISASYSLSNVRPWLAIY